MNAMESASPAPVTSSCDFCEASVPESHQHVMNTENRTIECACDPCAILFSNQGAGKYKRIPRTIRALPQFQMSDEEWETLVIPIDIAFLYHSSKKDGVVALYPSPVGAVESELDLGVWNQIEKNNPSLANLETDVEGVLIDRTGKNHEYFRIPIDECFRLVGMVRVAWRGFTGGPAVKQEIAQFIDSLKQRSR